MSAESLALTRKNASEEIRKLAEEHFKHDLRESDRDTLMSAAGKAGTHATIGSLLGLGLGVFLAFRIRSSRTKMFNAFRTAEKPTHVKFADGREGTLLLHFVPVDVFCVSCMMNTVIQLSVLVQNLHSWYTLNISAYVHVSIEAIPDISPALRPSALGDIATYFFFGAGGLFLGGETGLLTGNGSASRTISKDPDSRARIEAAFRKFRADVLRKEADAIDSKESVSDMLGF